MDTRAGVLEIFERHRATPGAAFEESHFADFLLAKPRKKRAVHDSFAGLRRYNAFIDEVQLRFSICFSLRDFEASYSLGRFVERVGELQASRRSSLMSFRNQRRFGFGWGAVVVLNAIAIGLIALAGRWSESLAIALIVAAVLANVAVLRFFLRSRRYSLQLLSQLRKETAHDE